VNKITLQSQFFKVQGDNMNPRKKIILIVTGIIVILIVLSFIGIFSEINKGLNKLVAGTPDKSCSSNSDCVIKKTRCSSCDCASVVNKNWNRFCPLPDLRYIGVYCKDCISPYDLEIKCVNNQCQTSPRNK